MRRPTGVLSHHKFVQLSRSCVSHHLTINYRPGDRFVLPDEIKPHLPALREYWQNQSPELQDFDSIVCLTGVTTQRYLPELSLTYRPATYFEFLYSNYSLDVRLSNGATLRQMYEQGTFGKFGCAARQGLFEDHYKDFRFPSFGNSLGITISMVTADNQFIMAKRSAAAQQGIARDQGNWLCAVGTQVKRHQPSFLDQRDMPHPNISVREGLRDEMGAVIARNCHYLRCLGLVYREDFHRCELLYEVLTYLTAAEVVEMWSKTPVPDRREFERIQGIDLSRPEPLLEHLTDQRNQWSPQHAAGALHSLAWRFPASVSTSEYQGAF